MRLSLGATRWRIVRQQMTESGVLLSLGGSSGVLFAWLGMGMLLGLPLPPSAGRLDGRLLAFSLGLSLLTALACGVLPALRTTRIAPVQVLRGARAPGGPGRNRTRLTLVAVQVSLSFTLLVGAALFCSLALLCRGDPAWCGSAPTADGRRQPPGGGQRL